jgi:hypothetical protein
MGRPFRCKRIIAERLLRKHVPHNCLNNALSGALHSLTAQWCTFTFKLRKSHCNAFVAMMILSFELICAPLPPLPPLPPPPPLLCRRFYHPANARVYFYGDDAVPKRLELLDEYLKDFDKKDADPAASAINWQVRALSCLLSYVASAVSPPRSHFMRRCCALAQRLARAAGARNSVAVQVPTFTFSDCLRHALP